MDGTFMVYEPDGKIIPKGELQAASADQRQGHGRKVRGSVPHVVVPGDAS